MSVATGEGLAPIPVVLLTGFLGAGKTSWLNARLRCGRIPADSVLLLNDFGRLQIDAGLVAARDDQVVRLANGCICCSLSDNLASQLSRIAAARPRPAALYIEGSGIAHPRRLHEAIRLNPAYRLVHTLCLVDAGAAGRLAADPEMAALWRAQIGAASRVLVNRVPDAGLPEALARVLATVTAEVRVEADVPGEADVRRDECGDAMPAGVPGGPGSGRPSSATAMRPFRGTSDTAAGADPGGGPRYRRVQGDWQNLAFSHPGQVDACALERLLHDHADVVLRAKGWLRRPGDAGWQVFQYTLTGCQWLACARHSPQGVLACVGRPGLRLRQFAVAMQALGFTWAEGDAGGGVR